MLAGAWVEFASMRSNTKTQTADSPGSRRNPKVSYPTVKQWIYKGKLRTVKTPGGRHRIPEEDIEKHLRASLAHGSRE
jgi:excisionase family DNA binding protein